MFTLSRLFHWYVGRFLWWCAVVMIMDFSSWFCKVTFDVGANSTQKRNVCCLKKKKIGLQQFLRKLESRVQVLLISILCHSNFYWPHEEAHALSVISDWQLVVIHASFQYGPFHLLLDHFHTHKGKGGWKPWIRIVSGWSASSEVVGNKTLTMESLIFFASYSIEGKPPHNKRRTVFFGRMAFQRRQKKKVSFLSSLEMGGI